VKRAALHRACMSLEQRGVIAYPTEAVFGLGCDPRNAQAVGRILALKRRSWRKGLILVAADYDHIAPFVAPLDAATEARVFATWPGPVTWLLPVHAHTPTWLCGHHDSLAVRLTAHPQTVALCRAWGGALVSTSANPEGCPPARTARRVHAYFGNGVDMVVAGATGGAAKPSEIRDARSGHIVRAA
jgi:L-threonylcarbamoyladenylate synthase